MTMQATQEQPDHIRLTERIQQLYAQAAEADREEARAAYEHARRTYRRLIAESPVR